VANFIGTMNRLEGRVEGGRFVTAAGTLEWPQAPAGATQALFRPESVRLAGDGALAVTVSAAFFLGDHTRLVADCAGQPLTFGTAERREFRRGEALRLAIDPEALIDLPS
jgi:ABC-type sugar transport system ATPase subunit